MEKSSVIKGVEAPLQNVSYGKKLGHFRAMADNIAERSSVLYALEKSRVIIWQSDWAHTKSTSHVLGFCPRREC